MKKIKGRKVYNPKTHGFDIHGSFHEFKVNRILGTAIHARDQQLKNLVINDKVHDLFCGNNHLKYIRFNQPVTRIICHDNLLTHIKIPEGTRTLYCDNNPLTKLDLPDSLNFLRCDKELFDYDTCNVDDANIYYD
jgi:hypothetical protein